LHYDETQSQKNTQITEEERMSEHSILSTPLSRLKALKKKHTLISERLREEMKRPAVTDFYLVELKKQKLWLKDQIEILGSAQKAA
jgi:hypothetical protein